jgi:hypothetical protein
MIRAFLSLFGPRCDFGVAVGRGCWRRGMWITEQLAPRWSRRTRWCSKHANGVDVAASPAPVIGGEESER